MCCGLLPFLYLWKQFRLFSHALRPLTDMLLQLFHFHPKPKNEKDGFQNVLRCPFSLKYGFVLYYIFLIESRIELGCSLDSVYNSCTVQIPLLTDFWLAIYTWENLYSLAVMVSSVSSLHPAQVGMSPTTARFFELWCRKCGGKGYGYRVLQGLLNPKFSFSDVLRSTERLP